MFKTRKRVLKCFLQYYNISLLFIWIYRDQKYSSKGIWVAISSARVKFLKVFSCFVVFYEMSFFFFVLLVAKRERLRMLLQDLWCVSFHSSGVGGPTAPAPATGHIRPSSTHTYACTCTCICMFKRGHAIFVALANGAHFLMSRSLALSRPEMWHPFWFMNSLPQLTFGLISQIAENDVKWVSECENKAK